MKIVHRDPQCGYLDTFLWVPKQYVNVEGTKGALSFSFTDSYQANKVRYVYLWKETKDHLLLPRAFWKVDTLPFRVVDLRPTTYRKTDVTSKIRLDHRWKEIDSVRQLVPTGEDVQAKSIEALLESYGGTLQLACGKGKTAIALELITRLQVPALVVVPDTQLFQQWKTEVDSLLDVPGGVGVIQGPKFDWQKSVVLTTYHTIGARASELPEEVRRWFGIIVWDEGHHVPAPTFAASAEAFYGYRLSLSATPDRVDGLHVINEYHIGPTVYKDLRQHIKPNIYFRWTDLEIDETRPEARVRDKNGELHLSLVANYYARWPERQQMILDDIATAVQNGRKVLVVSTGEADLANLAALWTFGPGAPLYTDIPKPTPAEMGETVPPLDMTKAERTRTENRLKQLKAAEAKDPTNTKVLTHIADVENKLRQNDLHNRMEAEMNRRQHQYIKWLQPQLTNCGLMIYKVKPEIRQHYIDTMPVVFAIMKYGKEGLDAEDLDTVLVSTVFSNRNGLQQLMGRTLRQHDKKKAPTVIFYEDNIGTAIGMCKKLRTALREWPVEDGGPFDYEQIGHPHSRKRGTWEQNKPRIFG